MEEAWQIRDRGTRNKMPLNGLRPGTFHLPWPDRCVVAGEATGFREGVAARRIVGHAGAEDALRPMLCLCLRRVTRRLLRFPSFSSSSSSSIRAAAGFEDEDEDDVAAALSVCHAVITHATTQVRPRPSCGDTRTCNRGPRRARGKVAVRTSRSPSYATWPRRELQTAVQRGRHLRRS